MIMLYTNVPYVETEVGSNAHNHKDTILHEQQNKRKYAV